MHSVTRDDVGRHDGITVLPEPFGDRGAEPAGRAGDENGSQAQVRPNAQVHTTG